MSRERKTPPHPLTLELSRDSFEVDFPPPRHGRFSQNTALGKWKHPRGTGISFWGMAPRGAAHKTKRYKHVFSASIDFLSLEYLAPAMCVSHILPGTLHGRLWGGGT